MTFWNAWCAKKIEKNRIVRCDIDCIIFRRIGEPEKPDCPDYERRKL